MQQGQTGIMKQTRMVNLLVLVFDERKNVKVIFSFELPFVF